jgi:hypothetical protein
MLGKIKGLNEVVIQLEKADDLPDDVLNELSDMLRTSVCVEHVTIIGEW